MLEVMETSKLGIKTGKVGETVTIVLNDDITAEEIIFKFPAHLYSEKALKEKIKMLDKTGLASVEGISPALNLIGKVFNEKTKKFEEKKPK